MIKAGLKFLIPAADKGVRSWAPRHKPLLLKNPFTYVARQPILAADEKVLGYELLFHQGPEDETLVGSDVEGVTCAIIDTLNAIGLGVLCDGHRAFIDCTHQMLLMEYFTLLPPEDCG